MAERAGETQHVGLSSIYLGIKNNIAPPQQLFKHDFGQHPGKNGLFGQKNISLKNSHPAKTGKMSIISYRPGQLMRPQHRFSLCKYLTRNFKLVSLFSLVFVFFSNNTINSFSIISLFGLDIRATR
ncbi:MAG: hypothetical protein IKQ16_02315 [Lentisphaeria bacterium]|nr:hypothetical protein [Lentisphaeria bacterium]